MPCRLNSAFAALIAALAASPTAWAAAQSEVVLVGIDHVPLAVRDLDRAAANFRRTGFALKPGRAHDNGISNRQIKFVDGSGLELITAARPADALSGRYVEQLAQGEGPAYLALHARDQGRLVAVLQAAGIKYERQGEVLTLQDPRLDFLFIVRDNRSPSDRPAHFAHANGAFAMREVWLAMDDAAPLRALLIALGVPPRRERVHAPAAVEAEVYELQDQGRLLILPAQHRLLPGRPVIGVVMARQRPGTAGGASLEPGLSLAPADAHGMWLLLRPEARMHP